MLFLAVFLVAVQAWGTIGKLRLDEHARQTYKATRVIIDDGAERCGDQALIPYGVPPALECSWWAPRAQRLALPQERPQGSSTRSRAPPRSTPAHPIG